MRRCVVVALLSVTLAGCHSGGYDADYRARLQKYRQEGEFSLLHREPKSLVGGRVLVRVPKAFTAQDEKGEKKQSKPPFLQDIPGFAGAYETLVEADGAKVPAVLSIGVTVDNDSNLDDIKKKILAQVQKQKAFEKEAWGKAEGEAGADGQPAWSVLRLAGPQPFERVKDDNVVTEDAPGTTEIWVAADAGAKVATVLVWRIPQQAEAAVPLQQLAGLVSRTVEMKAAAPAGEPAAANP